MGVGRLKCPVINVGDLAVAEAFWSEVTGLPVITSHYTGRFSYLGQPDPWDHQMILQLDPQPKTVPTNRCHVDIHVRDIDTAIQQVQAIGGTLKKPPTIYPRPGSFPGKPPVIDWAVMADPFDNEFCLVSLLTETESSAALAAATGDHHDDTYWRTAAGRHSG
jgi:predicted enzyme related to lactoylglutathione lyase